MRRLGAVCIFTMWIISLSAMGSFADDSIINTRIEPPEPIKGEDSRIRMVEEHLDVYFGARETTVEVVFFLENLTDEPVSLTVGFPDTYLQAKYVSEGGEELSRRYRWLDEKFDWYSPIEDFVTWVDMPEIIVKTKVYRLERLYGHTDTPDASFEGDWDYYVPNNPDDYPKNKIALWHAFKLDWEPRQKHIVGHKYRTDHGGINVGFGQAWFIYSLRTGSTWAGTIGRLEVNLYLTDGQVVEDLALDEESAGVGDWVRSVDRDEWEVISPTHMRLIWEDFEPIDEKAYIDIKRKPCWNLLTMGRKYKFLPKLEELLEYFTWDELVKWGFVEAQGWEKPAEEDISD